ncbi:unnamed protein product [Echinostoma caproni]|uniref:Protein TSSC4 n=1 Tax=Echinostoma caproni TaxID=27848 RepID=A0A183B5B1_9TREM|nr:unnamed protein product [Echinostoma caproni]
MIYPSLSAPFQRDRKHPLVSPVPGAVQYAPEEFRRPISVPRTRGHVRSPRTASRDPTKWIHYTLADVDEDGFGTHDLSVPNRDPNCNIALSFLSELRERREAESCETNHEEEATPAGSEGHHRILFRSVHGTKRARVHDTKADQPKTTHLTIVVNSLAESEEDQMIRTGREDCTSNGTATTSLFILRRQRTGFRGRQVPSAEGDFHGAGDDNQPSATPDVTMDDNEVNEMDGGADGEEEEEELETTENDFLA